MKIRIHKEKLLNLILHAQGLVEKRSVIPILSKILLKYEDQKLKIYATDQESSLQSYCETEGKEGAVCIDARSFFEIIKELPNEELELEKKAKNHNLIIRTSSSHFNMVGIQVSDFPVFPYLENPVFFKIEKERFLSLIQQTSYCASLDETRYHLNGALCEKKSSGLRFVATDGHRLSYADQKINSEVKIPQGVIIPRKGLSEISRLLLDNKGEDSFVEIAIHPPRLVVKYENFLLSIRLIEGKYPNYTQLIPKSSKLQFSIESDKLIQGIKRVSIMSNQQSKSVLFSFSKKKLVLSAKHPDQGSAEEEVPLKEGNGEIEIRFNARYILDSLTHSDFKDHVVLKLSSSTAPGMVVFKDGMAIIMPMKI